MKQSDVINAVLGNDVMDVIDGFDDGYDGPVVKVNHSPKQNDSESLDKQFAEVVKEFKQKFKVRDAELQKKFAENSSDLGKALVKMHAELTALANSARKVIVELHSGDSVLTLPDGEIYNEAFAEVIELASAGENIFLPGPTGSGKTKLAEQVSVVLGRKFGMVSGSAGLTESALLGRSIPNLTSGKSDFIGTEFLDCFENGGVFLFDEADAADANMLLVINSALANGYIHLPFRQESTVARRHKDFVMIFAANTWGRGSDRQYVGRNKLDAATLDRFIGGTVPVTYSLEVERHLCPDASLLEVLLSWREKIVENAMMRILSTRFIAWAYRWKHKGIKYIAKKLTHDQGWKKDEAHRVIGNTLASEIFE